MELNQKLDWLIDQWCGRRALRPLSFLLRAYPAALVHADQFGAVLDALKDVSNSCRNELTSEEMAHVISSIGELKAASNSGSEVE